MYYQVANTRNSKAECKCLMSAKGRSPITDRIETAIELLSHCREAILNTHTLVLAMPLLPTIGSMQNAFVVNSVNLYK